MIKGVLLSKLREFEKDLDPEKYMTGEYRQNLRSIELFLKKVSNLIYDPIVVLGNPVQSISNGSSMFNLDSSLVRSGRVESGYYYPSEAGRYFIEFSAYFQNSGAANGSSSVAAFNKDTKAAYSGQSQVNYSIAGGVINSFPHKIGFFADLYPNIGVGFKGVSSNASLTISNLNFKITKVG